MPGTVVDTGTITLKYNTESPYHYRAYILNGETGDNEGNMFIHICICL